MNQVFVQPQCEMTSAADSEAVLGAEHEVVIPPTTTVLGALLLPVVHVQLRLEFKDECFSRAVELVVHLPRLWGEDSEEVALHIPHQQDRGLHLRHVPVQGLQGSAVPCSGVEQLPPMPLVSFGQLAIKRLPGQNNKPVGVCV